MTNQKFRRFAIYFSPDDGTQAGNILTTDATWAQWATAWLGWDLVGGYHVPHPAMNGYDLTDCDVANATETPRKYGLHATIKPPFRLREDSDQTALASACRRLAGRTRPVTLSGLAITRMGRFLALCPLGDQAALNALAASWVTELDGFRAASTDAELARRRNANLSHAQETNLLNWGYPYVLDQFRFHITLTGKIAKAKLPHLQNALDQVLTPQLPAPLLIRDLTLVGEDYDGMFHLVGRYPLSA
jgi:hypothetical protein